MRGIVDEIKRKRKAGLPLSNEITKTSYDDQSLGEIDRKNRNNVYQKAVELAKTRASSNSNVATTTVASNRNREVNAGDNRTTAINTSNREIPKVDLNTKVSNKQNELTNPLDKYTAGDDRTTAVNNNVNALGLKVNNENRTPTNKTSTFNFANYLEKTGQETTISEEQSIKNATKIIEPYLNNEEIVKTLDRYSELREGHELSNATSGLRWMPHLEKLLWGNEEQKVIDELKTQTNLNEEEALNLAENYKYYYDYKKNEEEKEIIDSAPLGLKIAALPLTVLENVTGNALGGIAVKDSKTNDPNLGRNYNSGAFKFANFANNINESVKKDIDKYVENPALNWIANTAYQVPVVAGTSLTSASMGPHGIYTFVTGGYSSALREAENRGLTKEQAQTYAGIMGATEYITEKIPFTNLSRLIRKGVQKEVGKNALKGSLIPYVKEILKQMKEEGIEEVESDVVDLIADQLINGDKSKHNLQVNYYMSKEYAKENKLSTPLTKEEAEAKAYKDDLMQIVDDFVMGALSGGTSAGTIVSSQAIGETKAGRTIFNDTDYINDALTNKESPEYISESREDYTSDEEYEQAQDTRKRLEEALAKTENNEKLKGKEARALYENVAKAEENKLNKAYTQAEEQSIERIKEASTPVELETAKEAAQVRSEAVVRAAEVKKAELKSQGATEVDFTEAITPSKALQQGIEGKEISKEVLDTLPEETKQAYEYGKITNTLTAGKDVSKSDVEEVWVEGDKNQRRQHIEQVKFNKKGEITFITDTGKEVNAYDAKYSTKGEQLYKAEGGILSLNNPDLIKLAIDTVADTNNNYPIASLTQAIKTMDTLGRTQGTDFDTFFKNSKYKYMESVVGREVLEEAYNAHRDTAASFDEGKKTGAVKAGRGIIAQRTEENAKEYDAQFDNADITNFINQENNNRKSIDGTGYERMKNDVEEAMKAFEDMSEAQKLFLEAFSKRAKVDFDFIYSKNGDTRGAYQPEKGKILLNLAYGKDIFEVALHEGIGEFLQAHNAAGYNAITDSILNYYAATQTDDLAENIRAYQRAYGNRHYRESFNELANDAMGRIFSTDEGLTELINWLDINETTEQAKTVKKTFLDYFNAFKNMISDILKQGGLKNQHIKDLKIARQEAADYAKQLLEAMDVAIENRDAAVGQQGENAPRKSLYLSEVLPTAEEQSEYHRWMSDLNQKLNKSIPKSNRGEYIFQIGNKLVYNMGKEPNITQFIDIIGFSKDNTIANIIQRRVIIDDWTTNKRRFASYGRHWCDFIETYTGEEINIIRYFERNNSTNTKQRLENKNVIFQEVTADFDNSTIRARNHREIERTSAQYESLKQKLAEDEKSVNNARKSLSVDSAGHKLSQGQQKYFTDSKVVDENGNLLVVYHGTNNYGFTEFNRNVNFYTDNPEVGKSYANSGSDKSGVYEGYLKITNPYVVDAHGDRWSGIAINDEELKQMILNDGGGIFKERGAQRTSTNDIVSAIFTAFDEEEADYDGVIFKNIVDVGGFFNKDNILGNVYVTFNSNQFKNVDNTNPTESKDIRYSKSIDNPSNGYSNLTQFINFSNYQDTLNFYLETAETLYKEGKISKEEYDALQEQGREHRKSLIKRDSRFSLNIPVEATDDLVAIHNLSPEQLLEDLKLGGFPSPSIAVIRAAMDHTKYGSVSVLFGKNTIDPAKNKKNKVYGGDAWTPTFPSIEYKINENKRQEIKDKIASLTGDAEMIFGYIGLDEDNLSDYLNRRDGLIRETRYYDDPVIKIAFLNENGIKYRTEYQTKKLSDKFENEEVKRFSDAALFDITEAAHDYEFGNKNPKILKDVRKWLNKWWKKNYDIKDFYNEKNFDSFDLRNLCIAALNYRQNGESKTVNIFDTKASINGRIEHNLKDYNEWFDNLFNGIIEKEGIRNNKDSFTNSGNRRSWEALHDDVTLDNLVKAMNFRDAKGDAFFAQSALQAIATKDFRSIQEIKDNINMLNVLSDEEYEAIGQELNDRATEIAKQLMDPNASNQFMELDKAFDLMADTIRTKKTAKAIFDELAKWNKRATPEIAMELEQLISDMSNKATGYFEAKPERAVYLDEILNVIVPENETELIAALDKNNIPYNTYEKGNNEQRKNLANNTHGARFSKNVDSDRVMYARGTEIVQNPTGKELEQMENDILKDKPWLKGEPLLRHTYDEQGNTYYWEALAGLHSQIEPYIAEHYKTRVNQQWKWYDGDDPDFWANSSFRRSIAVFGDESQYADTIKQSEYVSQILSVLNNQIKGTSVNIDYIKNTADYILDKYQANINKDDFVMELSQFIAYMTKEETVDYNQMMNYLMNIGDEVIAASDLKDSESQKVYDELKQELSTHKINLTEVERKELISKFGGDWKQVFGKLNAIGIKLDTKQGQHMDAGLYTEITDRFREIAGVYLDESTTPVDQIATIIDAMDALTPTAYQWDGASNMDKALDVATTIIDRYYSMATAIKEANIVKGTEKGAAAVERAKQAEIKKLRAKQEEWKSKLNKEFQALVEDKKKLIQEQQEFYRRQAEIQKKFTGEQKDFNKKVEMSSKELEKTARMQAQIEYQGLKDNEAKRKQKENITRTCTRLVNWMNKPTDARHVPTFLKPALSDMIKSINFMPASMRQGKDGTIVSLRWQETMAKLQQVIKGLDANNFESLDDSDKYNMALVMNAEDIVDKMQQLLDRNSGVADLSRLSREDLKTLSDIMTSISKAISQMNENFMNRRYKHVYEAAIASMDEMAKLKPYANKANAAKDLVGDFMDIDMLEPISFFEEFGEAATTIMQEFFDGEKTGINIIRESEEFFNNLGERLKVKTKDLRAWEKDVKDYTFDGGTITLSKADIMSLYCSYIRETKDQEERPKEATHHIAAGGIKGFRHKQGLFKYVNRNPQALHVTQAEVLSLINSLSDTQIKYADEVVKYMSTTLAAHGNETSNKISGYSKFNGKYYFPLKTDTNAIATTESNNVTGMAGLLRLVHPSFTKTQLDKADNALVIMNFFDVVTEHITGMSNYCAYAMPISDALRYYNYAETNRELTDEENSYQRYTRTVKGSMDRVKGDGARKYFEKFIRDVNMDNRQSGTRFGKVIPQYLTGLAKAKAVGLNLRVIVQQPCAIVRAKTIIEGKYLWKGWNQAFTNPKKSMDYAQKNNPLAYWKSKGMSDTRVSQSMKEIITGYETKMQDIVEKTGILAGLADDITWAAMYYAAENKIKDTTNLDVSSEEFRTAVDELYSDIINHTQVIDSQLRKSGTMRSTSEVEMLANAFKKEPQKTFNMLHRAKWEKLQATYSEDKDRILKANKKWHQTIGVFIENAFVTAIAQSIIDAWRDDEDDEYLVKILKKLLPYDSWINIYTIIQKDKHSIGDVLKIFQEAWGGMGNFLDNMDLLSSMPFIADLDSMAKGYSVSRLDSTSILTQMNNTISTLSSTTATPYKMLLSISEVVGYGTGIGTGNALKDFRGIWNQFIAPSNGMYIAKNQQQAKRYEKEKKAKEFSKAFENNDISEITNAMNTIYDEAIAAGKNESAAWTTVRDSLKDEYISQVKSGDENQIAIQNRFKVLLKKTKRDNGKRYMSDKEIENTIENWNKAAAE